MIHRNNASWAPVAAANPEWDGKTLRSNTFGDIYFSIEDGQAESEHVFIAGSNLATRFATLAPRSRFTIGELGFGTGLNFALTCRLWSALAPSDAQLQYIGIDAHPLGKERLTDVSRGWPDLKEIYRSLLPLWPHPLPGCHRRRMRDQRVTLDLWWEDAGSALDDLASHGQRWVDAWFLDGFAPSRNTDMWAPAMWQSLNALSRPEATVATFTAAGDVRRGLEAAGFRMSKRPGFGRKRECLQGVLAMHQQQHCTATPWDRGKPMAGAHVTVIGAGLAGAHTAHALAVRGLSVLVLDAADVASGGSANRQGITYTRLSPRFGNLSDFATTSYQYALPLYRQIFADQGLVHGIDGDFCGYLQLNSDQELLDSLQKALGTVPGFAEVVDPERASKLAGVALNEPAIWYPEGGWLHPGRLIQALLDHPRITVRCNTGPVAFAQDRPGALLIGSDYLESDATVVACAGATRELSPFNWLPLQDIRGQTTLIGTEPPLDSLATVICRNGYLPPAIDGEHWIGASFGPNDCELDIRDEDHLHNLSELRAALPDYTLDPKIRRGRTGLRSNTRDYLPVAGPAVRADKFTNTYPELRTRSRQPVDRTPPVHEGLWCIAGLGSRGITAAPLLAEIIAAHMLNEPPPVPRYLQRAISPARFLERWLKRGMLE